MVHLHKGILHSRKKDLLPFTTAWVDLESIMLSEVSQEMKDNRTNKQNRTRDLEIKNKLTIARGERVGE